MKRKVLSIIKWMGIVLSILILAIVITAYFYMKQDKFGKNPAGERLERLKNRHILRWQV